MGEPEERRSGTPRRDPRPLTAMKSTAVSRWTCVERKTHRAQAGRAFTDAQLGHHGCETRGMSTASPTDLNAGDVEKRVLGPPDCALIDKLAKLLAETKFMTFSAGLHTRVTGLLSIVSWFMAVAALCGYIGAGSSASAAANGNDAVSGPPVINPAFGARMPRKCSPVTHLPSEAEAAALAQCATESGGEAGAFRPMIYLWQNVRVQMGKSRPYAYNADSHSTGIDTTSPVYPIRVTGDQLSCTGKATCMTRHADHAEGTCYNTTFGDWQCYFSQVFGVTNSEVELPAPTTY